MTCQLSLATTSLCTLAVPGIKTMLCLQTRLATVRFTALAERSEKQVKEIIDSLENETNLNAEEKMIRDFYNAYMDVDAINAKGMEPIAGVVAEINAIENVKDLTMMFGKAWQDATISPIGGFMGFQSSRP